MLLSFSITKTEKFSEISEILEASDLLVFNNTRVIPARMYFHRASGARIEVFLLHPVAPFSNMEQILECSGPVQWECMIGNLKKWKDLETIYCELPSGDKVKAKLLDRSRGLVELDWSRGSMAEMLLESGKIPLPPYIDRANEELDQDRYQTVYAERDGAVAAPTAGLHFTDRVLQQLDHRKVRTAELTLHVGAGTFQPVKDQNIRDHTMHQEVFIVNKDLLTKILGAKRRIATGTTSLRALESIYWMGVKAHHRKEDVFELGQFEYESLPGKLSFEESLIALCDHLDKLDKSEVEARTAIMIVPGYEIKSIDALITNFHLPKSTLIMLISAWVGPNWRKIYEAALKEEYRFLSYGDSSILFK